MNEFHGNYLYRPTKTEKKERKVRNHREEACKCFPPFVKLHHHDCPLVMKPCPIHGDFFHIGGKEAKMVREQNVIISFHPSSKTERLLQPIRSLLGHCNSETKINFQYYSPGDSVSKDTLKLQNGQNTYENIKRSLNNNIFIEKTKSFVAEKTNKMKKLKQRFHSPCNSIAQKTLSQTSIKDKINQILREEAKQTRNMFYNMVPEVPPNDKKWFPTNERSFKNSEKLLDENIDSDFITVTQKDKNSTIHHKIFEIKHKKGVNDIPFVGFPRQPTQLVYSTVNFGGEPINQTSGPTSDQKQVKNNKNKRSIKEENEVTGKNVEVDGENQEKTQRSASGGSSSSSSGSVYITPFIFVPRGMEDSDTEVKANPSVAFHQSDKSVQVEDPIAPKQDGTPKHTQTSPVPSWELIQKPNLTPPITEKPQMMSVLQQTDSSGEGRIYGSKPFSETRVEEIYIDNERTPVRNFDDDSYGQKRSDITKESVDSGSPHTTTTELRKDCPYREVLITARWDSATRDQTSQTDDVCNLQVRVKTFDSRINKSQTTVPHLTERGMQTLVYQNPSEDSEFIHIHSPNVTYVIKSFDQQESDQDIGKREKSWWGKSYSDGELSVRLKVSCGKDENENPILLSDFSKRSNVNKTSGGKSTAARSYDSDGVENHPTGGSVTLTTEETIERFSEAKKTPMKEEFSAGVSDLSELKNIIQEFFERRNFSWKSCDCDKTIKIKGTKTDGGIVTDSFILSSKPSQKLVEVGVQTPFDLLPRVEPKPEKVTCTGEVQTVREEKHSVEVQTLREGENDAGIQTDIHKPLDEAEPENLGHQKVRLHQSVIVDSENRTFLVCAECARAIKNSADAATSTVNIRHPERGQKPTPVDTEYSEVQVKFLSKEVRHPSNSSNVNAILRGKRNEGRNDQDHKTPKPQDSSRATNATRSGIPVPVSPTFSRSKNEETVLTKPAQVFLSDRPKEKITPLPSPGNHTVPSKFKECICEIVATPSRNKDQQTLPMSAKSKGTKDHPKSGTSTTNRKPHGKNTAGSPPSRYKSQRKLDAFPVIVTPFWPRYFMKTWKSMESSTNDNHSSDDSKPRSPKPKRTYEKDLEIIGTDTGKKIKVDIVEPAKEYTNFDRPVLSRALRKGGRGGFKIWPIGMMACKSTTLDEQAPVSADDILPQSLLTAPPVNLSEDDEENFGESESFSDYSSTSITLDTSLMENNRNKQRKRKKKKQHKILFSNHFPSSPE